MPGMEQIQVTPTREFVPEAANSPLAPDTILQGRYRIVRQLGRGGMGAVYEALDERLGIAVALKETFSSEASMRKQFEHEARLLASMQHPALPRVSDHFVEGNRAFLVMQFIGGVDLARIIAQQPGPLPREQVIAWADQLLDALIYLHTHDRQVIHRDIKPHNLKLTSTGQIALLDFGLARAQSSQASDHSITSSHAFFGYTRHYAPLEQIQDQRTDPRTDIYALGATLYHLLTGIKPPDAMVRATALLNSEPDPLKPADKIHEAVGPEIAAILNKAMAQKAQDRYASANEFREAFRRMGRANQAEVEKVMRPAADDRVRKVHISARRAEDREVVRIAMVESARRFGPASMTAVFLALITLGAAAFYGAQRWLPGAVPAANSADALVRRQPAITVKSERPRTTETTQGVAKPASINSAGEPIRKVAVTAEDKPSATPRPRGAYSVGSRRGRGRIGAPSIRLPNPEFRNSAPEPSPESRFRTYSHSGARSRTGVNAGIRRNSSASLSPRFFRAPDGTQIVKFSGGLTRVIRPGERNARSEASYR